LERTWLFDIFGCGFFATWAERPGDLAGRPRRVVTASININPSF